VLAVEDLRCCAPLPATRWIVPAFMTRPCSRVRSMAARISSSGGYPIGERAAGWREGLTRRAGPGAVLGSLSMRFRSVSEKSILFNSLHPVRLRAG
jgi:hypothetical protein